MKGFLGVLVLLAFCGLCYGEFLITYETKLYDSIVKMNTDGSNIVPIIATGGYVDSTLALNGNRLYYRPDSYYLHVVNDIDAPSYQVLGRYTSDNPQCVVSSGKKLYLLMINGTVVSANLKAGEQKVFTTSLPTCATAVISGKKIFFIAEGYNDEGNSVILINTKKKSIPPTTLITLPQIDPNCAPAKCRIDHIALQGKKLWMRVHISDPKADKVVSASLTGTDIQVAFTIPFGSLSRFDDGFAVLSNNDVILINKGIIVKFSASNGYSSYVNLTSTDQYEFNKRILVGGGGNVNSPTIPNNIQQVKCFALSWNPVAGATSYTIFYSLAGSNNTPLTATTKTNSITVTSGVTSGTWNVKVVASIGDASSSPSATFSVVVA